MAGCVNDWLEHTDLLPPRPKTFIEHKYKLYFALNCQGREGHDQYVFVAPNGLCVVGLAPSHPLIRTHRSAEGFKPTNLKYVDPPKEIFTYSDVQLPDEDILNNQSVPSSLATEETRATSTESHPSNKASAPPSASSKNGNADGGFVNEESKEEMTLRGDAASGPSRRSQQRNLEKYGEAPTPFPLSALQKINFGVGFHDWSSTKSSGKRKREGGTLQQQQVICHVEGSEGAAKFPVIACVPGRMLEVNQRLLKDPGLLFNRPCREGFVAILMPKPEKLDRILEGLTPLDSYLDLRSVTAEELL